MVAGATAGALARSALPDAPTMGLPRRARWSIAAWFRRRADRIEVGRAAQRRGTYRRAAKRELGRTADFPCGGGKSQFVVAGYPGASGVCPSAAGITVANRTSAG